MKWSWKIARLAGIDVFIHWTFLLLLIWIGALHFVRGESIALAIHGLVLICAFFACIVLHELGHALMARRFGVETRDITLLPIGGVARLARMPEEPWQEFWIAVAGPAVNVALALILGTIVWIQAGVAEFTPETIVGGRFIQVLFAFNVVVVLFNLLPAFPMDGGRVLRALLATRMSYVKATAIAASIGQLMAMLFGIIGLFINPLLLFIALFVYLGAEAEAQHAQLKASTDNVPVTEAMMTYFRSLAPGDSLSSAVDELLAGAQQDFPVIEDGRLCGMLCREDLVKALADSGSQLTVGDVMNTEVECAASTETLDMVLTRMRESGCGSIPVLRDGSVVGLLTLQNVGELIMVRSALRDDQVAPENIVRSVASPSE